MQKDSIMSLILKYDTRDITQNIYQFFQQNHYEGILEHSAAEAEGFLVETFSQFSSIW